MDITVGLKPEADSFNSYPSKIPFTITENYVTIELSDNGDEGTRTLTFKRDEFLKMLQLMEK